MEYGQNVKQMNPQGQMENCLQIICPSGDSQTIFFGENKTSDWFSMVRKPVIAFRDFDKPTKLEIIVNFHGKYKMIYPKTKITPNNDLIWKCQILPNNSVVIAQKSFPYLFWDGVSDVVRDIQFDQGFCVEKDKIISFLEKICCQFGFDDHLRTDFVTFWSPFLIQNDFSLVKVLTDLECAKIASLEIKSSQRTDKFQIIRMYIAFKKTDKKTKIKRQTLPKIQLSNSPKIFDWGGFEI